MQWMLTWGFVYVPLEGEGENSRVSFQSRRHSSIVEDLGPNTHKNVPLCKNSDPHFMTWILQGTKIAHLFYLYNGYRICVEGGGSI